ncbi:exonuclease domain-containing protein [Colwellia sp. E150_009]
MRRKWTTIDNIDYSQLEKLLQQHSNLLIVDIETTCTEDGSIASNELEIIEIGALLVCTKQLQVVDEFQFLIKSVQHPKSTVFCRELSKLMLMQPMSLQLFLTHFWIGLINMMIICFVREAHMTVCSWH